MQLTPVLRASQRFSIVDQHLHLFASRFMEDWPSFLGTQRPKTPTSINFCCWG